MIQITDAEIKRLTAMAMIDEAIASIYKSLAEVNALEENCRAQRVQIESSLGYLIAQKLVLLSYAQP